MLEVVDVRTPLRAEEENFSVGGDEEDPEDPNSFLMQKTNMGQNAGPSHSPLRWGYPPLGNENAIRQTFKIYLFLFNFFYIENEKEWRQNEKKKNQNTILFKLKIYQKFLFSKMKMSCQNLSMHILVVLENIWCILFG